MRWAAAGFLCVICAVAHAQRVLLVPVDNRPAAGQFAQMIGKIAGAEIRLPPYEALGRFTQPGQPDRVLDWLETSDYSQVSTVIVSTDMVAYGGLIASRTNSVPYSKALERLRRLATIRRKHPEVKFFAFSAVSRLLPTATKSAAAWRLHLGEYVQLRERARAAPTAEVSAAMADELEHIPRYELRNYDEMRLRNLQVQRNLLRMASTGVFDYLMLGQDDAAPAGPHIRETARLRKEVADLSLESKVYFCEGIDQHSNVLVSRALLRRSSFIPRVKVVYSDEAGRNAYANFESKPIEKSVADQLLASGARPVEPGGQCDYVLYLNSPKPRPDRFEAFLQALGEDLDAGRAVAVADINLNKRAAADPKLFEAVMEGHRATKLLAYAGWNTAGNTIGTAIPAANMVVLGRRSPENAVAREVARSEFVLHRLANDFAYHQFTRPAAYNLITNLRNGASRDEIYGDDYAIVSSFVRRDLRGYVERYFGQQFQGEELGAGGQNTTVAFLDNLRIFLPWPRAYEVRLEFKIVVR